MAQFTKTGHAVAKWAIVFAIATGGYLWMASMPEPERTHWFLTVAFAVAFCVALESRSQVRELQKRIDLLEKRRQ